MIRLNGTGLAIFLAVLGMEGCDGETLESENKAGSDPTEEENDSPVSSPGGATQEEETIEGDRRAALAGECDDRGSGWNKGNCPEGFTCRPSSEGDGLDCVRLCSTEDDCEEADNGCYDVFNDFEDNVCAPRLPECHPLDSKEECECDFVDAVLVSLADGMCEVIDENHGACVGRPAPCGDMCFEYDQMFDIGDGTALVRPDGRELSDERWVRPPTGECGSLGFLE